MDKSAAHILTAQREIEGNLRSLDRGRDDRDVSVLIRAFLPAGRIVFGPSTAPVAAWIERVCTSPETLPSRHRTVSSWIALSSDTALSESHCIARVVLPDAGAWRFLAGRYLDRNVRTERGWAIDERRYILDWTVNVPAGRDDHPLERWWNALPPGETSRSYPPAGDGNADAFEPTVYEALAAGMRHADHAGARDTALSYHSTIASRWRAGPDRIVVERDIVGVARRSSLTEDILTLSRHSDIFVRSAAGWVSMDARCQLVSETRFATSETAGLPFHHGSADASDPVFAFWARTDSFGSMAS
jgi:hypothetical protein